MTNEIALAIAILGGVGGWTVTIVVCTIWLTSQLRRIEKTIYREMGMHRREIDAVTDDHGRRIDRLEIKIFGFSFMDATLPPRPENT